MKKKPFSIVLLRPKFPVTPGLSGAHVFALDIDLILIKPYGFDLSEKSVRRAGLDYWKNVRLTEFETFDDFIREKSPANDSLFLFSKAGEKSYFDAPFKENCYLIFGSETKGLPPSVLEGNKSNTYKLPMFNKHVRSLNLSNVATAVGYECLRKLNLYEYQHSLKPSAARPEEISPLTKCDIL